MLRSRSELKGFSAAARPCRRWLVFAALALLVAVPLAAASLDARVRERFAVEPLGQSLLLRPLDASTAVRSIELPDDDDAALVNGKRFSDEELRAFLGRDGELVAELLALDGEERRAELGLEHPGEEKEPEAGLPTPPEPPRAPRHRGSSSDDRVSFGQSIHVGPGESARDVVCIGCSIDIEGHADGDTVAVGGSVRVGPGADVEGNAVSVGGRVAVGAGALVEGDAVSVGGTVSVDEGGKVEGKRTSVGWGEGFAGRHGRSWDFGLPFWIDSGFSSFFWSVSRAVLLALFACLFLVLARRGVERTGQRVSAEPWKAALAGLLTQLLFVPVLVLVTIVLAVSIVGIPLLVLVPVAVLALIVGALLGYVAVARQIGLWAKRRFGWNLSDPFLTAIVGVLVIQGVTLLARALAMIGGPMELVALGFLALGFLVRYVAWTIGLGAVMLATLGRDWRRSPASAIDGPELPPVPPTADPFLEAGPEPPSAVPDPDSGAADEPPRS